MLEEKNMIVPALRVNNRSVNQTFLEEKLGMKTILEEGPFAEFAGHKQDKKARLVLIESPSMRTRAVKGLKKLAKITLKVKDPAEIESLLAEGAPFSKLYRGKKGLGFETSMPEGYRFLLHSEENSSDLQEILPPVTFTRANEFSGLTEFSVEKILINTPNPQASKDFYQKFLPKQDVVAFQDAKDADLLVAADSTWDLDSLRVPLASDADLATLKSHLSGDFFIDKKETFLQTTDPSNIEIWFEK
jgi:hypothetical protein